MKPRNRYTDDFKSQALALCAAGKPVAEVAADLCISRDLIYAWKSKSKNSTLTSNSGQATPADESTAKELARLRREVAELKIDNDILKKAAVILGTKNPNQPAK